MKILVAEDEPIVLKIIELRLKKDGYTVITTENGKDALEEIEKQAPDLVITDIMMPFASGLEILGKVKNREKKIPVIILSAMGEESVVLEAFKLGADDYIEKPFNANELSVRVMRLLNGPK